MRLFIQGCLILLLCFFSLPGSLRAPFFWGSNGASMKRCAYLSGLLFVFLNLYAATASAGWTGGSTYAMGYYSDPSVSPDFYLNTCTGSGLPNCYIWSDGSLWQVRYGGVCESPNDIDVISGECVPPPQEPAECYENGLSYDNETQQCVEVCEHGELNGACLLPPEDNNECTKESPDYRGEVVIAYGKPPIPACGDFDQCSGDQPGQVGLFNGELRCLPEDFGVPECKGDSITVVDEYGFVCEPLTNKPEEPETPEEPNTDTDGDGQPDEYNPDNDPNIQRKQLDRMNDNQEQANDSLANLENIGKGTNSRLDDINSGVSELVQMGRDGELGGGGSVGSSDGLQNDQGEDYLGDLADIKQNTKDTADALQAPEGGFDTSGWLNAPTFEQSINGFGNAVSQSQIGQLVSGVSNIPSSSTCPVYVIPGTDYWEPMNMDVHCDILEKQRATLSVLFMFFWTVSALFLFFRA